MKTATVYSGYDTARRPAAFPNAASNRQMLQKLLDNLLLGACGIGVTAMILLVLVLL